MRERKQREFDEAIRGLIQKIDFVAFGVGIRKHAFEKEFVTNSVDPY